MFLKFWILWALLALTIATWLFKWAVNTGQFEEARRAALLPLDDVEPRPAAKRGGRWTLAYLLALVVVALGLTTLTVILALVSG